MLHVTRLTPRVTWSTSSLTSHVNMEHSRLGHGAGQSRLLSVTIPSVTISYHMEHSRLGHGAGQSQRTNSDKRDALLCRH